MAAGKVTIDKGSSKSYNKYLTLLNEKRENLNNLVNACEQSVEKLKCDARENLQQFYAQRDSQIKDIIEKYNEMEHKLTGSSGKVINEFTEFIDEVVKPQRDKVDRANELLQKTLSARRPEGILKLGGDVEESLMKIIKAELPELFLSQLIEFKLTGQLCREPELTLVSSGGHPFISTKYSSVDKPQQGCDGDPHNADAAEVTSPLDSAAEEYGDSISEISKDEHIPRELLMDGQLISFSGSLSKSQFTGFGTYLTHSNQNILAVDSYTPTIYRLNEHGHLKKHIIIDPNYTVVGISASDEFIYVHIMDVAEYVRVIHVYDSDGEFIKKMEAPNPLGASITLVNKELVISSRDKITVCSLRGKHIKCLPQSRRCIRKLSTLQNTDSIIMTCCSNNQVVRLDVRSEKVMWTVTSITAPVASTCDNFGRLYILAKPSQVFILNSETGETVTSVTLPCADGVMEDIHVTGSMVLIALTNHTNSKQDPDSYSILNTYNIEHVC